MSSQAVSCCRSPQEQAEAAAAKASSRAVDRPPLRSQENMVH
jgi:hypothetical protein